MRVELRDIGTVTVLDLFGNIRTTDDYSVFKTTIEDILQSGKNRLLLNFQDVSFINSSGLGRLVLASKRARQIDGSITIYNLSDDLTELFSFTRLEAKIPVFKTEDEALASLQ